MCNKKVIYYLHPEAQDGFYPDMPDQYETAEGILIGFEERTSIIDGKAVQYTVAKIKDIATEEIKIIEVELIKEYVK